MESIRQAIERAKADQISAKPQIVGNPEPPRRRADIPLAPETLRLEEVEIRSSKLEASRIVAHNGADQRSRPYDMLRTQILHSMAQNGWKILGVTSPTPGCGKTLTAINLSFSVARQPDQSVMLVDMDLRKPQLANYFGISAADDGVLGVLSEHTVLPSVVVPIRAGNQRIAVLPTANTKESAELMGSVAMRSLLRDLRRDFQTVILDLPPVLSSDDVLAVLPYIDCILLVAAVGLSKTSQVEEAVRHLQSSPIVRLVLNKTTGAHSNYYYY